VAKVKNTLTTVENKSYGNKLMNFLFQNEPFSPFRGYFVVSNIHESSENLFIRKNNMVRTNEINILKLFSFNWL